MHKLLLLRRRPPLLPSSSSCRLLSSTSKTRTQDDSQFPQHQHHHQQHLSNPPRWPDPVLGVLGPTDPRFSFPGGVGVAEEEVSEASEEGVAHEEGVELKKKESDIFYAPTNIERQAQTLYSAHDFIQFNPTEDNFEHLCSDVLSEFPAMRGREGFVCELHQAPQLLKREVQSLFPGRDLSSLSVMTLSQKTSNDMSVWSDAMEEEREHLTEQFVAVAKELCARLKDEGHWCDFIDPSSGTPFYSAHSSTTLFETNENYRLLGFRIEDLGCCKVISHRDFGRHVFVGTLFADASVASHIMQDALEDLNLAVKEDKVQS